MGGNNRQRKSSGFSSIFNIFKSKKSRGEYNIGDGEDKVWPSDYDNGRWGVGDPGINKKADDFIREYKKRVSESELRQLAPAAAAAAEAENA